MTTFVSNSVSTDLRESTAKSFAHVEHNNARDARHALGEWLGSIRNWTHWITLTFGRKEDKSSSILEKSVRNNERPRLTGRTVMHEQAVKNFITCLKNATMEQAIEDSPGSVKRRRVLSKSPLREFVTLYSGHRVRAWSRGDRPTYAIAVEENPGRVGTHVHSLVDFSCCSMPPRLACLRHQMSLQGIDRTIEISDATSHGKISPLRDYEEMRWNDLTYAQKRASYMVKYCLKQGTSELHLDDRIGRPIHTISQGTLLAG